MMTEMSPIPPPYSPSDNTEPMSYSPHYWSPSMLTYLSPVYIQNQPTSALSSMWSMGTIEYKPDTSPLRCKRLYNDFELEKDQENEDNMTIQDVAKLILHLKVDKSLKANNDELTLRLKKSFKTPVKINQEIKQECPPPPQKRIKVEL